MRADGECQAPPAHLRSGEISPRAQTSKKLAMDERRTLKGILPSSAVSTMLRSARRSQKAPSAQRTRAMLRGRRGQIKIGRRRKGHEQVSARAHQARSTSYHRVAVSGRGRGSGETHQTVTAQTEPATTSAVPTGRPPSILPPSSHKPVDFVNPTPPSASWRMAKAPCPHAPSGRRTEKISVARGICGANGGAARGKGVRENQCRAGCERQDGASETSPGQTVWTAIRR